jgi:hypothetical protein
VAGVVVEVYDHSTLKEMSIMLRKLALSAVVTVALNVAVSGQSDGRRHRPGQAEGELIAMSRQLVATETGALMVADDGARLTPSGPLSALEVKGQVSGKLEAPVVSITGDEAVVTGRVVFKGASPDGQAINQSSGVRIRYLRESGRWKFVGLCLGTCDQE